MRETQEKTKGITLIALVITIIVLLILAGVTIAMLSGENGILRRATEAVANNKITSAEELASMNVSEQMTKYYNDKYVSNNSSADIETYFKKAIEDTEKQVEKGIKINNNVSKKQDGTGLEGTITIQDTSSNRAATGTINGSALTWGPIAVASGNSESGQGSGSSQGGSTIDSASYGDPVSYSVDLDGNTATNDWRIFYSNSNGTYIIAADYLNNSLLPSATNMGTYNGYPFSAYWPSEDNLTKTTIDSNSSKFMNSWSSTTKPNGKAVAALLDTSAWSSFLTTKVKNAGGLAIGGPTLDLYLASWEASGYTHLYTETNDNGYYIGKAANPSTYADDWGDNGGYYVDMSSDSGYNDTLYYPHKDAVSDCYGYWLASPSAYDESGVMYVYCGGDVNYSSYGNVSIGVRPVVFLPSSIQLTENASGVWELN